MRVHWFLCLLLLGLSSCATWVRKPQVDSVKSVALVSIYMDISHTEDYAEGRGGQSVAHMRSFEQGEKTKQREKLGKLKVVTEGAKIFKRELASIPQWSVSPFKAIVKSDAYKNWARAGNSEDEGTSKRTPASTQFVTPPGLEFLPVEFADDERGRARLGKLAETLGVDAVAIVHIVLGYSDGWIGQGSKTQATPRVASELRVVTSSGELAVVTPPIEKDSFIDGEDKIVVAGKKLQLGKKGRKKYYRVIRASAKKMVSRLTKELGS